MSGSVAAIDRIRTNGVRLTVLVDRANPSRQGLRSPAAILAQQGEFQ